jgi:hypothetical protein
MSGRLWFAAHKMESCLARDAESGCAVAAVALHMPAWSAYVWRDVRLLSSL